MIHFKERLDQIIYRTLQQYYDEDLVFRALSKIQPKPKHKDHQKLYKFSNMNKGYQHPLRNLHQVMKMLKIICIINIFLYQKFGIQLFCKLIYMGFHRRNLYNGCHLLFSMVCGNSECIYHLYILIKSLCKFYTKMILHTPYNFMDSIQKRLLRKPIPIQHYHLQKLQQIKYVKLLEDENKNGYGGISTNMCNSYFSQFEYGSHYPKEITSNIFKLWVYISEEILNMEPKYVLLSWKFIPPYVGKRPNITIII
ncbi:unnamed protein product [Paramecium primaurelia]|uniref:Transmembrane protein n=1 Tax=Paramecium primaurelia TaxID=5886 RepID=A0A8S1MWK0_PARPR|nr:unnamed protein product [Paramecium primaurelia]